MNIGLELMKITVTLISFLAFVFVSIFDTATYVSTKEVGFEKVRISTNLIGDQTVQVWLRDEQKEFVTLTLYHPKVLIDLDESQKPFAKFDWIKNKIGGYHRENCEIHLRSIDDII